MEGGDPSKLPLDIRKNILRQICEQIANNKFKGSIPSDVAMRRFVGADLTADVKEWFRHYGVNKYLEWFLLGLIWLGNMKELLPEAKSRALSPATSQYVRIMAFRAARASGNALDMQEIRAGFLHENAELNREWLSELINSLEATGDNIQWLLECLAKVETKDQRYPTGLSKNLVIFVQRIELVYLPQLAHGLNSLLNTQPEFEHRHCRISKKFAWLLKPAARAVQRLIEMCSPVSLEEAVLAILHKLSSAHGYGIGNVDEERKPLFSLVPAWPELNRALFWHEARETSAEFDKKTGERLTGYWQVSLSPFWKFEQDDFEYAVQQITERPALDEKLIALSLACDLYIKGSHESSQRSELTRAAAVHIELEEYLARRLNPPSQNELEHEQLEWQRRSAAMEQEEKERRKEWRTGLQSSISTLRNSGLAPGEVSGHQFYLWECMDEKSGNRARLSNGDWKCLIDEFGEDVARAYRDGAVQFWRGYRPQYGPDSPCGGSVPRGIIFGLVGLQIEANESPGWPHGLKQEEIEIACRYAFCELNGLPEWFSILFNEHCSIVSKAVLDEICYELSMEQPDVQNHYIISKMSYAAWTWDSLGHSLYAVLESMEPVNIFNLDCLLKIVLGSSVSDNDIARLASSKSVCLAQADHSARWFAVWTSVDPLNALSAFEKCLESISIPEESTSFAMRFIVSLLGSRRDNVAISREAYKTPHVLKHIYLLIHKYIRVDDDISRPSMTVYSPGLRDEAQEARSSITELIRQIPGKEAYLALTEIAQAQPRERGRFWFTQLAKDRAELDADLEAWLPQQLRDFHEKLGRTPSNHRELAELAHFRLLDLKDSLEHGDDSIADTLQRIEAEPEMRNFIGHWLRDKSFGRYSIPQEEELADAKKVDLRFHSRGFDAPVPVELKLVQKWTGPELFERMENQLCGDYLRDIRSAYGIFLLVHQGEKDKWELPGSKIRIDFDGLVHELEKYWKDHLTHKFLNIACIYIVGIDLTKRST